MGRNSPKRLVIFGALLLGLQIPARLAVAYPLPLSPEGHNQGTGTGITIQDPTPTATPSPTFTPTPPPTPTSTPVAGCPYVFGRINWRGWRPIDYFWGAFQYGSATLYRDVPCVRDMIRHAWLSCDWINNQYEDDCYSIVMGHMVFSDGYWRSGLHSNGSFCEFVRLGHNHAGACGAGWFYLDNQCRVVPASQAVGNVPPGCSFSVNYYESSPISLLLDESAWKDTESTVVRFPLSLHDNKSWYTWKASGVAPLLVFDPAHTGKITSASQLFGEWAFGGQRVAALASSVSGETKATPWSNGYEALATQDADGNGRVDGEELRNLALWFDENRDGVSQQGEVRPLGGAGVTALFYEPDRRDESTRSLFASQGFERQVNGVTTRGSSVDWYGAVVANPFQLIDTLPRGGSDLPALQPTERGEEPLEMANPPAKAGNELIQGPKFTTGVSGAWQWSFVDMADNVSQGPGGYLLLREYAQSGKVTGISIAERPIIDTKGGTTNNMLGSFLSLKGERRNKDSTDSTVEFSTWQPGNVKATSTASLQKDDTLLGSTRLEKDGQVFVYRWSAVRVDPGKVDAGELKELAGKYPTK